MISRIGKLALVLGCIFLVPVFADDKAKRKRIETPELKYQRMMTRISQRVKASNNGALVNYLFKLTQDFNDGRPVPPKVREALNNLGRQNTLRMIQKLNSLPKGILDDLTNNQRAMSKDQVRQVLFSNFPIAKLTKEINQHIDREVNEMRELDPKTRTMLKDSLKKRDLYYKMRKFAPNHLIPKTPDFIRQNISKYQRVNFKSLGANISSQTHIDLSRFNLKSQYNFRFVKAFLIPRTNNNPVSFGLEFDLLNGPTASSGISSFRGVTFHWKYGSSSQVVSGSKPFLITSRSPSGLNKGHIVFEPSDIAYMQRYKRLPGKILGYFVENGSLKKSSAINITMQNFGKHPDIDMLSPNEVFWGGEEITIYGHHFEPGITQVYVSGRRINNAQVHTNDAITFRLPSLPPSPQGYKVWVENGQKKSNEKTLKIFTGRYKLSIRKFKCIREASFDGGTTDDEVFFLFRVESGSQIFYAKSTNIYDNIDSGEERGLGADGIVWGPTNNYAEPIRFVEIQVTAFEDDDGPNGAFERQIRDLARRSIEVASEVLTDLYAEEIAIAGLDTDTLGEVTELIADIADLIIAEAIADDYIDSTVILLNTRDLYTHTENPTRRKEIPINKVMDGGSEGKYLIRTIVVERQ